MLSLSLLVLFVTALASIGSSAMPMTSDVQRRQDSWSCNPSAPGQWVGIQPCSIHACWECVQVGTTCPKQSDRNKVVTVNSSCACKTGYVSLEGTCQLIGSSCKNAHAGNLYSMVDASGTCLCQPGYVADGWNCLKLRSACAKNMKAYYPFPSLKKTTPDSGFGYGPTATCDYGCNDGYVISTNGTWCNPAPA